MIKIKKLIEMLGKYPDDARAYAYEGEIVGIIVIPANDDSVELGYILAGESIKDE